MSQQNEIREDLKVNDAPAVAALKRVQGAVGRIQNAFRSLWVSAQAIAGIGGLFAIGEGLRNVDDLYQRISKLKTITGQQASELYGMDKALERTGFSGERVEGVLVRMEKKTAAVGKAGESMRETWKRMGVDINDSATMQLLQMSKAAAQGKVGVASLMTQFGIGRGDAAALLRSLQKGPEVLRGMMTEAKNGAGAITDATLAQYEKMAQARRNLKNAWENVVGALYNRMMPVLTKVFDYLTTHMDQIVAAAKVFAAVMTANKLVNALTGKGLGGILTQAAGSFLQKGGGIFGAVGKVAGAVAGGGGGAAAGEAASGIAGALGGGGGGALAMLPQVLMRLGPYALIAVVALAALYKVFKEVTTATSGIGKTLRDTFESIWTKIQAIAQALQPVIDVVKKVFGFLVEILADEIMYYLNMWATIMETIIRVIITIGGMIKDLFTSPMWVVNHPGDWVTSNWRDADITASLVKQKQKPDGDASGKPPSNVYDFRGSHFDVTQNFPEGFDPGRVAATFADELGMLSERKLQSGFAPLFSARSRM